MDVFLLVFYLFIAIGFSFFCSIAEAVLLSITPSFVAELKEKHKDKRVNRIIGLKENIDRPLAAILSMNTIAHTVGAAGVGAQAVAVYGSKYVGVTSAVLTLLILVFSEIIPKTIGAVHWRKLAGPIAWMVQWLIVLMFPLVWLSEWVTAIFTRGKAQEMVTREELVALAGIGGEVGQLHKRESKIVRHLLRMQAISVEKVMTPRTVVKAFESTNTLDDIADEVADLPFSRIPIFTETREHITGFVLKNEILAALTEQQGNRQLQELARAIPTISENASLIDAFEMFIDQRIHIAVCVDEYGAMEGILTLEDVVETMLGLEIVDEQDQNVDMRKLARQLAQLPDATSDPESRKDGLNE